MKNFKLTTVPGALATVAVLTLVACSTADVETTDADSTPASSSAPAPGGLVPGGTLGTPIAGVAWDEDIPVPSCDLSDKNVVYVSVLRENPVLRIMAQGAIDGFKAIGFADQQWLAPQGFDEPATVALADQAITQGIDGMVVFPTSEAFYPMIKRAQDAGIPVIGTHSPVEEGDAPGILHVIAPDPQAFGATAAEAVAAELQANGITEGSVAMTQTALILNENQATEAFRNKLNELMPALNVLDPVAVGGDTAGAIAAETAIVQGNPDLVAAFGTYGNAPITWANTKADTGKDDLVVVGMDYAEDNLKNVQDGKIFGVVAQPLYQEHYEAAVLLGTVLCGEADGLPYRYSPPAPVVTKDGLQPYFEMIESVNIN